MKISMYLLRQLLNRYDNEEISISKFLEELNKAASQSTSVSTKANGEAEDVEGSVEREAYQLAMRYMENINFNGSTTWSQIFRFTNEILELSKESTPKVEAEDVEALAKEDSYFIIPKDHIGIADETTWEELRWRFAEMFKRGYKAAQSTPKEAPQVAVECYTKEQLPFVIDGGKIRYNDWSELSEEDKRAFIGSVSRLACQQLIGCFFSFGLKTHIGQMIGDPDTNKYFVLSFRPVEEHLKWMKYFDMQNSLYTTK